MTKRRNLRRRRSLRNPSRSLHHETLEKRELLAAEFGPRLISVAANSGEQFDLDGTNSLRVAPSELTFRFDGDQALDSATLSAIQFHGSGGDGSFDDGNETTIIPGFLGFADDASSRIVVARFQETLPDDQYIIQVAGFDDTDPNAPVVALRNIDGELFVPPNPADPERPMQTIFMDIELGPRVVAIVPQPIEGVGAGRVQLRDTVHVYFNNDPMSNPNAGVISNTTSTLPVVNRDFYKLLYTHDTVENTDDGLPFRPDSVEYDPMLNRATLRFASDLSLLPPAVANNGAGTFRLRVGSGDAIPAPPMELSGASDAGDVFTNAAALGTTFGTGTQSVVVTGGVIQAAKDVIPQWPGAYDAPGLRDYRRDAPIVGRVDTQTGINVYEYNFANLYGLDPQLNKLDNAITPAQEQRTREILGLFAERLGVEFVETENRGLQFVTGDLRALAVSADTGIDTPYSIYRVNDADPTQGVLVLDAGENWFDGYGLSPDTRPSWFVEAVRGVGALLGIGNTFELPPGDGSGGSSPPEPNSVFFSQPDANVPVEPDFLTQGNVITGQALHRPESDDIDFYRFRATTNGRVTLETFAQRLEASSMLDTHLKLYRVVDASAGQYELVASNDDFFSDDSFISVDLELPVDAVGDPIPTDFIVGVSAAGNDSYNGEVEGSGLGGLTDGTYDLRVTFDSQVGSTIADTNGSELDGDADGRAGGDFNFWFRVASDTATPGPDQPRVIFVDKTDGDDFLNSGTLSAPLETVSAAFAAARPGDVVRLLPSGGTDGMITTTDDNDPYEIGFGGPGNGQLPDGGEFEVPQGVTVMIDAGAILKLRTAKVSVGSESVDEDRSLAALQILGTPVSPLDAGGAPLVDGMGSVFFTSYDDATLGVDNNSLNVAPQPGNWAGIEFRNDFDNAEGRAVWENEGIFLDYASHANIMYGGGSVSPTQPITNALQMAEARPTLIHNTIMNNADAAISADPNSFLETNFHEPRFQRVRDTPSGLTRHSFTSDYSRVGPEIYGNIIENNSTNGLFVRVVTPAAGQLEPMTVSGRFDDREIVHVLSQVLVLQGQPGGSLLLEQQPDVLSVTFDDASGGTLTPGTFYDYRITFVTAEGRESLASLQTAMRQTPAGRAITLNGLPPAPAEFAGRRVYRLNPITMQYDFVTQLDRGMRSFTDDGTTRGGLLPAAATATSRLLPRFDARLSIDPGLIIKLENSRIEAGFGSDFYAEGVDGDPIVFTSRSDDSFGASGSFDTNNNVGSPAEGDWGGLVFRQDSTGSLDYVRIQYAGGTTPIEGGFTEFNPVEILQADVRIAHSLLQDNADGFISNSIRGGRGFNGPGAIFVRGSEPIIVDNTIVDNEGAAISINPDALGFNDVLDTGRSTGRADIVETDQDNQGPLISGNRLDRNDFNGLLVRSEVLQGESVWDDTDIVHIVAGEIHAMTHHHRGGLRLKSDANQSLVVKFDAGGKLVGSGRPLDIDDRIGGTLQVLGQGGFPVILTSLSDDSVGAGFTPDGTAQTNTDNVQATPAAGDWAGIELLSYVNDRNVAYVVESERAIPSAIAENAIADNAQVIGDLAADQYAGDETERLGFNIRGTLANPDDQDVYRFTANGGTVVYIDIDDTSFGLDTVVELIDVNDQVLASSDNSFAEATDPALLVNNLPPGAVLPLFQLGAGNVESPNSLDAGMRVVLDGTGKDNTYYVRVRSANGESSGQYQLSIRLRETEEIAGSTIQLADIRFATDAITVSGTPLHSPLAGDSSERLNYLPDGTPVDVDNSALSFTNANATRIGNLLTSDRGSLRVSGTIGNINPNLAFQASDEVDVYRVDLFVQQIEPDVFDSENRFVTTTFDVDYADQLGRVNTSLSVYNSAGRLILHSRDSNIADDVGRPLQGDDPTNLTGGSVGVLDAYIGPVELPEGTYYVAVSSAIAAPAALDQFFEVNPTNTAVRLMPINSIRRIADESLEGFIGDQYTADRPIIEPIFDDTSIVPYKLDDVRLFVSYATGISGGNRSSLASFNPFTGVMDRLVGQSPQPTGDIAARRDGELYAYSLGPQNGPENNGNVGNFLNISPANGAAVQDGDDGLAFQRDNQAGDDMEADDAAQLDILAMTFPLRDGSSVNGQVVNDNERFFVVGQRDNRGRGGEIPDEYARNIFYTAVSSDGEITSLGTTNSNFHRSFNGTIPYFPFYGSTSQDFEWGFVDTGAIFGGGDGGNITGLAVDPNLSTTMIGVTDLGGIHVFDYTLGVDGPGDFLTRASNVIPTNYFGQLEPDPRDFSSVARGYIQFQSLAFGPRQIEGQAFRNVLFAASTEGWLYAFEIDSSGLVPANVFANGRSAIQLTFEGGFGVGRPVNGLAFSILEQSPWHFTGDRGTETDHGIEIPYDRSRVGVLGGDSLYFGFEITSNQADNTVSRDDDDPLGEISPGGTQGTVISNPFSLEGYSPDDKPTLYFTYYLEVEDDDDYRPGPRQQNDSFRAYAAGDDGRWVLLATNDDFRNLGASDEYDLYDDTQIPVQELFDDSGAWRQARVDISPLAGNENVRIRFDFSTAGSMRHQFGSIELVAVDGDQIADRERVSFTYETGDDVVLENIVGKDVVIPNGSSLSDSDGFTVFGPGGPFTVTFVTGAPAPPTATTAEVQFTAINTAEELADAVVAVLPTSLRSYAEGGGLISMLAATNILVSSDSPIGQSNPTRVVLTANQLVVPDGNSLSSGDEFTIDGSGTSTRYVLVEAADATGDPDELIFARTDSAVAIATSIFARLPDVLDPVLETNGRITFINSPVSLTFVAPAAVNDVAPRGPLENRIEIIVPAGTGLVSGSVLDIFDGTALTQIQFIQSAIPVGPGVVEFLPTDSANDIAMRLQAQLPFAMDGLLNLAGDGVLAIAVAAGGAPGITSAPIGAQEVIMPSGAFLLDTDKLTVVDELGVPLTINFVEVTSPMSPIPPTAPVIPLPGVEGTVFFQLTDTAEMIAANVQQAFQSFFTTKLVGDTVLFFDATDLTSFAPKSTIINPLVAGRRVIENRLEILLPPGNLVDGSQLTIRGAQEDTTITFVLNTVPEGPGTVHFFPGDTSNDIATRLAAQLPPSLDPLFNLAGDGLLVLADDAFGAPNVFDQPIGAELITLPSGATPLFNDTVRVFDVGLNNPVVNFALVATPTPPVPAVIDPVTMTVTPGIVNYQVTDTGETIAANFALAIANFFVTIVDGDTVEVLGALNTSTTDPDSRVVHGPTLGQFIDLPFNGAGLLDNGADQLLILSPFGNVVVRFVEQAFGAGPNDVFYADGNSGTQIESRLQAVLPTHLRAIVTPNGTSGQVVQVLGATDIIPLNAASLIQTGPNAYARSVLNLDIKNGDEIRNGEQIDITVGFVTETITFVRRGSTSTATGTTQVFYDDTDLASDLYDQIVLALPQNFQSYIDLNGQGINIGAPGATAIVRDGVPAFLEATLDIDEFAIPITVPTGAELNDGETLTIITKDDLNGTAPITVTFREGSGLPGDVVYATTDSAAEVTQKLYDVLPLSVQAYIFSPREIYLLNATSVSTNPGSAIISFETLPGTVPVLVDSSMTSEEVAVVLQSALAEAFGPLTSLDGTNLASPDDFSRIAGDRIRIYSAIATDSGSYGVSGYASDFFSPIDSFDPSDSTPLPAEVFGEARPTGFSGNQIDGQGGANNNIEGVYIDDIIIGFAERGEMVINAPAGNRNFVLNPEVIPDSRPEAVQPEKQNETLTGPYALEIRTSDEYGVPEDYDPINLELNELFNGGRSFDTNDRLVDGAVTLIAQPGLSLIDGDTFVLDDGTRQLTFEFDSNLRPGVTIGNVAVPFDPQGDQAQDVARAIRDAVNSQQSRDVLAITASTSDSLEVGETSGNMVELFGPAITVNPGGGRFLKLDLVAEETFQGRETAKLIPVVDHVNQTVTYENFGDQQARAAVTGFADGTVDVLVADGKIGDQVRTGEGVDDAPIILFNDPGDDVDYVRIYLQAGQTIDIDVDTTGWARGSEVLDLPVITVLNSTGLTETNGIGGVPAQTSMFAPSSAPGEFHAGAFLKFQAISDGYYDVAIASSPFIFGGGFFFSDFGEYQLTIRPDAAASAEIPDRDVVMVDYHFGKGDVNRVQDQGQIIIASNFISDSAGFGVLATAGPRGQGVTDDNPRPGSVNLLRNINTDMLVPSAVISNNVVVNSGSGGINFAGGTANNGQAPAPVPYGRIVNNTVVGTGSGSGIIVSSNASPTLLNNLVSGFGTGLNIDNSSVAAGTVVGANAFQGNTTDSTIPLATTSVSIVGEVFQDPARRIYIPVEGSIVIDSSVSTLPDRGEFFDTVKQPVGISASPIIAPLFDAYGQPRFDDPLINPPGASGEVVTIDRGAIDRADRTSLVAVLTGPQDAIGRVVLGGDRDPDESFVRLDSGTVEFFEIQLLDPAGTGPDKDTITAESVLLTENGRRLIPNVDFVFGYSDNSRTIRLTPLAGLWLPDAVYEITLNNQQRIQYEAPEGSQISDGDQVILTDTAGNQSVFEYESGFSLTVPQSTLLTVTGTNAAFQDRDTFTITSPTGNSLTFEINLAGATAGGNVPVELGAASTIGEVRDEILATLLGLVPGDPSTTIAEFLDIVPIPVPGNSDQIQLGTLAAHTIPLSISGLNVSGQAGGIADGETFSYTSAIESVTFEFDSDGTPNDPADNNEMIPFARTDTPGDIAQKIVDAVQRRALGLTSALATDQGTVVLGGSAGDQLVVNQSSLQLMGAPGVTGSLTLAIPAAATGALLDGTTFSVDVDGTLVTFRYTTDPSFTSPDRLILVQPTDMATDIATATANVIGLAFPDELSPTAAGDVVTLGEQAAIPPAGQPASLTTLNGGTANLVIGGVSGGAIPVNFLTTTPRTSIAATLQAAIESSPLMVTTFSPGGGTILISDAQLLQESTGGSPPISVGILTPAVADLAGNPVRETRINNETRFTIIMPEVVFDFGDAPISYATLIDNNGARHTVGGAQLPRLGNFLDTETDGQVINEDDIPLDVTLSQTPPSLGIFTIDSFSNIDRITMEAMPVGSETLTVSVGPVDYTFELVEVTSNPTGANIAVTFSNLDSIDEVTAKLVIAIRATLPQTDDGLIIEKEPGNSFVITAVNDEDGVSRGIFSDGLNDYNIFTLPGTDPTNIQAFDVLGFLNPQDPAGTNIAVNVRGAGLLHAWIDFDLSGFFEPDEQVLSNLPVSGDLETGTFNFVTVFTPDNAIEGSTWMRIRVSESGNLQPTGVAVGGEVEDYPVEIISIPLPDPVDDLYTINEDATLDTLNQALPSLEGPLGSRDFIPPEAFLPVQYIVGALPTNGKLVSLDATTGHFVYEPNDDFNGVDTFTYRLSTQQNASASSVTLDSFATVTINVLPLNDIPAGVDQAFAAQEDLPLTISARDLLVGASPDADPLYMAPGSNPDPNDLLNEPFLNESNQLGSLGITAVQGTGPLPITAANTATSPGNLRVTPNGPGLDLEVTNATDGDLVSVAFAGTTATFELVAAGDSPQAGTVAVQIMAGDTTTTIAARLATAIETEFNATVPAVTVTSAGDTVSMSITPTAVVALDSTIFDITQGTGELTVDIIGVPNPTAAPSDAMPDPPTGDTLTISVAGTPITFELIAEGATETAGNIPITLLPFQNPASDAARASVAAQLAAAIQAEMLAADLGVVSSVVDGTVDPLQVYVRPATVTAGKPFETARGSAIALFDTFESLLELRYISDQDLNRDNPPPAVPLLVDEFTFTVRDNGVSIDVVNNRYVYGISQQAPPATATIDVAPQNDPPLLIADLVSIGPLGPDADTVTTAWETFGGETPTEDQVLAIDPAFLLLNDSRGPTSAGDENTPTSLNDIGLTVTSVTMVDPTQGTVELLNGTIFFTPADDIFGDVLFMYSAEDQGIDEDPITGLRPVVPLSSMDGVVTVSIQPVNDVPVAFDRALTYTESDQPGPGTPFVFSRDDLILGGLTETPDIPGSFAPGLPAPFNELEQTLRVVSFSTTTGTVDVSDLTGVGLETLTLASDAGATFEFDFLDGVFNEGRFISLDDYNQRSPFDPIEIFTYVIADDGLTTSPQSGRQFSLPDARSDDDLAANPGTVSITVLEANDAPTFDFDAPLVGGLATLDVLERDDNTGTVIPSFAIDIRPGPDTGFDETDRQSVIFSFPTALNPSSNVPPGLFTRLPELTPSGDLTVFPAPDAIGTATFVVQAVDVEPGTPGFVARQTLGTFVVNVQPVNDAPRFDPTVAGTSDMADPDEAYSVASNDFNNDGEIDDATITYTLREDNTQPMGIVEDYFIPLHAAPSVGYSRIGLLDVFTVGPENEEGPLPGGSQIIELLSAGNDPVAPSLDRTTDRGGILTPRFDAGNELIGWNYRPPTDFNVSFAGVDSFEYFVRDDSTTGGETFDLLAGDLVPDRVTRRNRVELVLNPVNDRPEFVTETLNIAVPEDSSETSFVSYASGISAGPPLSAFDEVDGRTGQLVEFTVTSLDFPRQDSENFFSTYPSISEQSGTLNFQPAANVFGDFRFELVLTDQNRDGTQSDNTLRGDLISSIPVTLTISVQPINDPPIVDPDAPLLAFELLEDGTIDILVTGDNTSPGLLDPFIPGPNTGATDESADVTPGGNQTVSLGSPIPTSSAEGGSIQLIMSDGTPRLQYTPRANFVGMDSFIYTVIDDGTTVGVDGVPFSDPRIASNTVTFEVLPVNDAPIFSGAGNVQSQEDDGVVTFDDWATNVQAGPSTSVDELGGNQDLQFVFTQKSSNTFLFLNPPTAIIDPNTGTATLTYETNPDASGIATFEVVLRDNGPQDASIGDQFVSDPPRTFTIDVAAVNDPPTFDLASDLITRLEDSGPFNVLQAINISPGPADEQSQTVAFEIEPLAPEFASLFVEPPTINSDGLLRFTPATNQNTDNVNGPAVIRVIARDSEGGEAAAVEFQIAITEVNDPPRAFSDSVDTDEDTVLTIDEDSLKQNDVDPDLDTNANEVVRIVMPPQSFSVSGASVTFDAATGQITYDPTNAIALQSLAPGDQLVDSFAYSLIDAAGAESNLVTVALNVDGINDAPILGLDTPQLNPDGPTTIRVLDNDTDIDGTIVPGSIRVELQPAFGNVSIEQDGTLVYTTFASFTEEDVFTYTVADDLNLRSEQVFVTISANASPIAADDARGTFLDEAIVIDVSANDRDPDGSLDLTSIDIVAPPLRGQAIPRADGTVQYLPDPGFVGRDSFQYRISDDQGRASNVATVDTQVVASRLQNPDEFNDVNDDGFVSAIDALLIINRLARADGVTSIPVLPTDVGPNFYDVSGNQQITAADALRVINELGQINNGSGIDAEQVAPITTADSGSNSGASIVDAAAPVELAGPAKLVDASMMDPVSDEVVELIASQRQASEEEESLTDAVDAAMASLL